MRRAAGFTLLEVLVALSVMAVGVALTLSLISGSLGNIRKVRTSTRLVEDARTVMELALLDESIEGPTTLQGDLEDGTLWSVAVSEVQMPLLPSVMQGLQPETMPIKMLSFDVEVRLPESMTADFRLQTMKLVGVPQTAGLARVPR